MLNSLRSTFLQKWFPAALSSLLIISSFLLTWIGGGAGNPTLTPIWWIDAGEHGGGVTTSFTLADLLMISAAITSGYGIVVKAIRSLLARLISIDLLVSVAAIGATVIGNFWEAAAVTTLFAIGNALEAATLNKTRSALAELVAVAPTTAVVLRNDVQEEIPAANVLEDEIVFVKNGSKVPVDGVVISGAGAIDESSITGESIPVEKTEGETVFAGTISSGGFLQVQATGVGGDTTLARIIHRVEEAQDAKAKTQSFIDRFSQWYTPAVMALALITGVLTGNVVLALTLLVIGCPGALVISIPVAIVAGIGRGARNGTLIKGGEFLETSARISAVALDKTGTLTKGRPELANIIVLDKSMTRLDVLSWAGAAEVGSEHPLARTILDAARNEGVYPTDLPTLITPEPGMGIASQIDERQVLIGNALLLEKYGVQNTSPSARIAEDLAKTGETSMIVAVDGNPIGVISVADTIRENASEMVNRLHEIGVKKVVILTGDTLPVAKAIGRAAGIEDIHASLLPEDKMNAILDLQESGYTVAMVGDGVNDAPALASADIGVAMGAAGSAVAIETADIALMGDDLLKLPQAISTAKRTIAVMRQNIAVALLTVALLLIGVFAGGITMSIGMLVHEGSVLIVILNAMRLLKNPHPAPLIHTYSHDVKTRTKPASTSTT